MKIIQVSYGGDTLTCTHSINYAMAAILDTIKTKPNVIPLIEIDIWVNGLIDESSGFIPTLQELSQIETYLNEHV